MTIRRYPVRTYETVRLQGIGGMVESDSIGEGKGHAS